MIQLVLVAKYNTHPDWVIMGSLFSHTAHGLILGLQNQSKKPIDKDLMNLECSFFMRKLQTSAL